MRYRERSYDEPLWLEEVLRFASPVTDPYAVVILACIFGTITRSSTGAMFGVGGVSGGNITGTGGFGFEAGFGVRDTLRVMAWGFVSDDPIGRCFGRGGEVYCQGSSGPGDCAGGVAFSNRVPTNSFR